MRITVGVPSQGRWVDEMAVSLIRGLWELPREGYAWELSVIKGPYLDQNREAILDAALARGARKLVFVDSDMVFGRDALARLLRHDKPIIGGAYNTKSLPPESTVKMFGPDGVSVFVGKVAMPPAPFKCAAVATGFLAIDLNALKTLPRPWFGYTLRDGAVEGEDIFFCRHAREHGFDVWCDPTLPLKHIGDFAY